MAGYICFKRFKGVSSDSKYANPTTKDRNDTTPTNPTIDSVHYFRGYRKSRYRYKRNVHSPTISIEGRYHEAGPPSVQEILLLWSIRSSGRTKTQPFPLIQREPRFFSYGPLPPPQKRSRGCSMSSVDMFLLLSSISTVFWIPVCGKSSEAASELILFLVGPLSDIIYPDRLY
jgi:hypothetical protein